MDERSSSRVVCLDDSWVLRMTKSIEDTVTDYLLKVEFNVGEEEVRSVWRASST